MYKHSTDNLCQIKKHLNNQKGEIKDSLFKGELNDKLKTISPFYFSSNSDEKK